MSINNFKDIADEIMKDVKVSKELKAKTLRRCRRKKNQPVYKILVSAACVALVLGIANLLGVFNLGGIKTDLIAEPDQMPEIINDRVLRNDEYRKLDSFNDAYDVFGSTFLVPGYIPENFSLLSIMAYEFKDNIADKIVMTYVAGNQIYTIIQEKTTEHGDYRHVDTNEETGFTRLYWIKDDMIITVSGGITQETAIRIAESLK